MGLRPGAGGRGLGGEARAVHQPLAGWESSPAAVASSCGTSCRSGLALRRGGRGRSGAFRRFDPPPAPPLPPGAGAAPQDARSESGRRSKVRAQAEGLGLGLGGYPRFLSFSVSGWRSLRRCGTVG
ncbi:hypothetical protein MPTK1_6g20940 [Marchantia polymorpha subsp. ruderalis]|uniref:Uncharacterized protein n=2 Tax=Marchantia polymorpha TaxID=3197 RepID=A0AAF6BUC1_MARPO|nr:hypothetical protein MARPO_0091s0061 [Marchantia polymorpha]BBN15605.1 hypothetical protein Mp_6g20940 [Marchantia polymorpha subsp. ruderalis]|eukprot:PTQ33213.1 hypothetical protein MARPO_0091s0061 [Marchantia polymorpha]